MLEPKQNFSFFEQFTVNTEDWLNHITKQLDIDIWIKLVCFEAEYNRQKCKEFLRRAAIDLVTEKIQNQKIKTHSQSLPQALLSLNALHNPESCLKDISLIKISLTYCKNYGIFACSPRFTNDNQFIGIDLELKDRVNKEVINKVSAPVEVFDAPLFVHLWTAKEASFKTLVNTKDQLISDINIHSWLALPEKKSGAKIWQYQFTNIQKNKKYTGTGWVIDLNGYSLAFSYLQTNTQ